MQLRGLADIASAHCIQDDRAQIFRHCRTCELPLLLRLHEGNIEGARDLILRWVYRRYLDPQLYPVRQKYGVLRETGTSVEEEEVMLAATIKSWVLTVSSSGLSSKMLMTLGSWAMIKSKDEGAGTTLEQPDLLLRDLVLSEEHRHDVEKFCVRKLQCFHFLIC